MQLVNYCDHAIDVARASILPSSNSSQIYICDESDLLLDKYAVRIHESLESKKMSIRGLAATFHSEKSYFMSATYGVVHKRLLTGTFKIEEKDMMEFMNLQTLITGVKADDFDLGQQIHKDGNQLRKLLLTQIEENSDEYPFIVFTSEDEPMLRKTLSEICESKQASFMHITNDDEAFEAR